MEKSVDIKKVNGIPCLKKLTVSVLEYGNPIGMTTENIVLRIDDIDYEIDFNEFMEATTFFAGRG